MRKKSINRKTRTIHTLCSPGTKFWNFQFRWYTKKQRKCFQHTKISICYQEFGGKCSRQFLLRRPLHTFCSSDTKFLKFCSNKYEWNMWNCFQTHENWDFATRIIESRSIRNFSGNFPASFYPGWFDLFTYSALLIQNSEISKILSKYDDKL